MSSTEWKVEYDEAKVDAVFAGVDQSHLPGVAAGIAIGGVPVYRKGFGLANLEQRVVISPSTRMRIGSTTKHFTSLAYLLLCEDGRATLDDPVGRFLPELHPASRGATMRQLMGHVSGLRDPFEVCYSFSGYGRQVTCGELLEFYRSMDDRNFEPGTAWMYNNGGYLLLSAVIERISGESLGEFFRRRIFEPVGMFDTVLRRWDWEYLPHSAALHYRRPSGVYVWGSLGTEFDGTGGIVSTVDDMLRWLAHMSAPIVGSEASWKAVQTPLLLANGASSGYGLGLFAGRFGDLETIQHAGGVLGANCEMVKIPSLGLDMVIMANRSDVSAPELGLRVLHACLTGPRLPKGNAGVHLVNGTFCSAVSGRVVQLFGRNGRQIAAVNGFEMLTEIEEDGTIRIVRTPGILRQSIVVVGSGKRPEFIRYVDCGISENLGAVGRPAEERIIEQICGRYRSDCTNTDATITTIGKGARLEMSGKFGRVEYELDALGDEFWRARGPWDLGGVICFRGGNRLLQFSTPRTVQLGFRRIEE